MKLRILLVVMMLLMPLKAQAAITWDFGAIANTIQGVIINVKTQIDTVKVAFLEWDQVQRLGAQISSVAAFFQNVKAEYDKIKKTYEKWRTDILNFRDRLKNFYFSSLEVFNVALKTAEHVSEIATRVQAYLNESANIIKDIGNTVNKCIKNAGELVSFRKHYNEQKEELNHNLEIYRAEKAAWEQELAALQANNNGSNEVTNRIRELSNKIYVHQGKIDNFMATLDDIDVQIINFINSQKSLVYECVNNARMIRGRIDRLLCNINRTEIKGFESKINQIGNSINNWNSQLISLDNAAQDLENNITSGCSNVTAIMDICAACDEDKAANRSNSENCKQCDLCKPTQGGEGVINYIPMPEGNDECETKIREILGTPGVESCQDYKNTCEKQIKDGNPSSNSCQISCSSMCQTIDPSSDTCCNIFNAKCNEGKDGYCNRYNQYCRRELSFNYSISTKLPTAFAFSAEDLNNIKDVKSGEDEYGNLILPDNLAACCQIDATEVNEEKLYNCLSHYIQVIHTASGTTISDKDKYFFQCLRREIGRQDFEAAVRPSDSLAAGTFSEEAYAEYLAGAYLDAMRAYQDSIDYGDKEINRVANSSYKDISSNWVAVVDMNLKISNRINEINKLWSREHLIKAVDKARNYKILTEEKTDEQ